MRSATLLLASLLALPAIMPLGAAAKPVWLTGTFVYANLCTNPSAGRLEGRRVTLKRSPNGNGVLYEAASGAKTAQIPADRLSIDDTTQQISFTVESADGLLHFQGIAAADVLAGTISDGSGEQPLRLRRVLRSHEREACQAAQPDPDSTASVN
ncbi:hypothetical protein [Methylobacterium gnaphalii]|uniref:Uncharacterized protein n=1 Tax=Methylobacterium gnaphalii TaxID=1010610 RepID=A0A512JN22_9HYPH|nr:hypothetical protein [Methylobacterium gnaphalii]GEP11324.1 hypothetical protein MGN01_31690 [Methylobacterium gnaphalii]GJD67172.1 hypothetical protein MMMDOFMJ_0086 [Methylobacterium gnaphalii]GLS50024.1 hypothetical protein GCM10007885_28760 [Methylobacterium gnaphalii]